MMMKSSKMQEKHLDIRQSLALLEITLTFMNKGNTVMSMTSRASEILLSCSRLHEECKKCLLNLKLKPLSLSDQINKCKIYLQKTLKALKEINMECNKKIYYSQT